MTEKEIKKLKSQLLEKDWLTIFSRILMQVGFGFLYFNINKTNENISDISITLMTIYVAIYAIDVSIYFSVYKIMSKNIEKIKNNKTLSDVDETIIKITKKRINRTLIYSYIVGIIILFSSFFTLTFNITPLINNAICVGTFAGTIWLLITLLNIVKGYHKEYII